MFGKTFAFLNAIGFANMPADLSPMLEMQYSQLWHSIVALVFHRRSSSVTSISARWEWKARLMPWGTGQVDTNWAKEHHSLWVEEVEQSGTEAESTSANSPAE